MNPQLQQWLLDAAANVSGDAADVFFQAYSELATGTEGPGLAALKKMAGGRIPDSYEALIQTGLGNAPKGVPMAGPEMTPTPTGGMDLSLVEPKRTRMEELRERVGDPKARRAQFEKASAQKKQRAMEFVEGKRTRRKQGRRAGREYARSLQEPGGQGLFPFGVGTPQPQTPNLTPTPETKLGSVPEMAGQMSLADDAGAQVLSRKSKIRRVLEGAKASEGRWAERAAGVAEQVAEKGATKAGLLKRILKAVKEHPVGAAGGALTAGATGLWILNMMQENRPENKEFGRVPDTYGGFKAEDLLGEIETKQATRRIAERMSERDPDLYQVLANVMGGLPPRPEERSLFGRGGLTPNEIYIGPQVSPDDIPDEMKAMLFQELGF